MNRRRLITAPLVLAAGAWLSTKTADCTASTARPEVPQNNATAGAPRPLLAYFSRPGENYYYGDRITLDVGNTEVVATIIASIIAVDVYRIQPADPYPHSYDATVARNVREQDSEARPTIAGPLPEVDSYDTVLLGSPIWNVRPPMIMRSFIDRVDLSGKAIHPFVTYAVSGMGATIDDYTRLCPGSTVGDGLAVRGEKAHNARGAVEAWLRRTELLTA